MEFVLKMLKSRLRTERIHLVEARTLIADGLFNDHNIGLELNSLKESLAQAEANIPQLEKAIKILTEWKDK